MEMKVFLSEGYGKGSIVNLPVPEVSGEDVLVRVCYCGICGTDQDLFSSNCSFAENGQVTYPVRLGHEWSGIVEKIGEKVTGFTVGDRVVGENAVACGSCDACKAGQYDKCHHMLNVGTIDPVYDGAFAEYYVVPQYHLHKVPEGISLKEACLAEPFSVAYGGIKKLNITDKSTVAVIGSGCIGMAAVILAKSLGARVFMIGRNPVKLEVARRLGAEIINVKQSDATKTIKALTNGEGADYVLECSGALETFKQAIDMVAFKGTVGLIGFYDNLENDVNIDAIVSKALTMFGVMGDMENMRGALKIIEEFKPDMSPIITDDLEFDQCMKGFIRENYPEAIKIVVKICEE